MGQMMIRVGCPKDRYRAHSIGLATSLGCSFSLDRLDRSVSSDGKMLVYLLKARDLPTLLSHECLDLAIVPEEWCMEFNSGSRDYPGWKVHASVFWTTSSLVFFGDSQNNWPPCEPITIATSFPAIVRSCMAREDIPDYHLLEVHGSVEALVPHCATYGFDVVETGASMRICGLVALKSVFRDLGLLVITRADRTLNKDCTDIARIVEATIEVRGLKDR
jgi:ATP phosphoribosyltransferase